MCLEREREGGERLRRSTDGLLMAALVSDILDEDLVRLMCFLGHVHATDARIQAAIAALGARAMSEVRPALATFPSEQSHRMRLQLTTSSELQTIALGEALGSALAPGDILALHGDLGAGKTRLVRGLARGAGADPAHVSSPTYVIMQEYACRHDAGSLKNGGVIDTLVHIDAYRLRGPDDLDTIGWDRVRRDLDEQRPVAVVIEWAERIDAALPHDSSRLDVRLAHAGASGETRVITIDGNDAWQSRPAWAAVQRLAAPRAPAAASSAARPPTRCPITGKPVPSDSPTYPFFDERARMADLGRWMSGTYQVSRDLLPDDEADPDLG